MGPLEGTTPPLFGAASRCGPGARHRCCEPKGLPGRILHPANGVPGGCRSAGRGSFWGTTSSSSWETTARFPRTAARGWKLERSPAICWWAGRCWSFFPPGRSTGGSNIFKFPSLAESGIFVNMSKHKASDSKSSRPEPAIAKSPGRDRPSQRPEKTGARPPSRLPSQEAIRETVESIIVALCVGLSVSNVRGRGIRHPDRFHGADPDGPPQGSLLSRVRQ